MNNIKYLIIFLLLPFLSIGQIQIGSDIVGVEIGEWTGTGVSLSADGNIVATGARFFSDNVGFAGAVRIFELQNGSWNQLGQDIEGEGLSDEVGTLISLSADGHIIAITSRGNSTPVNAFVSGRVRIFRFQNDAWFQIGENIDGAQIGDRLGNGVHLSSDGNIVAIGSPENDDNGLDAGKVQIFENQNETWVQIGEINGVAPGDNAGASSLSDDGSIVAVGSPGNDDNGLDSGHVRVFEHQNGTWNQIGEDINGVGGGSLSSDGNVLTIGNSGTDESFVRLLENQNGTWVQIGDNITVESGNTRVISADGNTIAIGDVRNDQNGPNSGIVYIYKNQNGAWIKVGEDITGDQGDLLGWSVSLSDDGGILAVGAPNYSTALGVVRVYDLNEPLSSKDVFDTNFSVYPNPSDKVMTFELGNWNDDVQLEIFDLTGKQMMTQNFANEKITLSKSTLTEGMYFYKITSKGNVLTSGKFLFL